MAFRSVAFRTAAVVLSVAFVALMLELGLSIRYFARHGEFIYWRSSEATLMEGEAAKGPGRHAGRLHATRIRQALHPYLGFSLTRSVEFPDVFRWTPGLGGEPTLVREDYGYPTTRRSREDFIIGVFGGSVASNVLTGGDWLQNRGGGVISRRLLASQVLDGRSVVLINFAQGAHKQPQQLLSLCYALAFGQQLDLAINIDGFNEVALGAQNHQLGVEPSFPAAGILIPLLNLVDSSGAAPEAVLRMATVLKTKNRLERTQIRISRTRSALVHFLLSLQCGRLETRLGWQQVMTDVPQGRADSILYPLTFRPPAASTAKMLEDVVDMWANASLAMHQLLSARGVPYLHVIQPNQYFDSDRRTFTEAESRVALAWFEEKDHPCVAGVTQGYPLLLEEADHLASRGVRTEHRGRRAAKRAEQALRSAAAADAS